MFTYLEILSGPHKGMTYRIRPGLRIGSGSCEVQIPDPAMPPIHSQVLLDQEDRFVLVCTNAVYEIKISNSVVKKLLLQKGDVLQIANVFIGIKESKVALIGALDPLMIRQQQEEERKVESPTFEDTAYQTQVSRVHLEETPKSKLLKELTSIIESHKNNYNESYALKLFKFPIHLKVEQGPNANDEHIVSWGPRDFGPMALEFPVEYPPFPAILFTLKPTENGEVFFSTQHPQFCKVEGQELHSGLLKEGSRIIAGNSTILFEFLRSTHGQNP